MEMNDGENEEFGFSRNYFLAKELRRSGKKSQSKISDIDIVDEKELVAAAAQIEPKHDKEVKDVMNSYKSSYPEWAFELRCGLGLLIYGFGSKKALLEDFASTSLTEYSVVVFSGYLQGTNMKQVVIALAELLWDQLKTKRSPSRSLSKAQQPFNSRSMDDLLAFWMDRKIPQTNVYVGQEDGSHTVQLVLASRSDLCTMQGRRNAHSADPCTWKHHPKCQRCYNSFAEFDIQCSERVQSSCRISTIPLE